jgi:hypothetical protein
MFYKISYTYIFLLLLNGVFVEFIPLWYVISKVTYLLPSARTKFICFVNICYMFWLCWPYISHVSFLRFYVLLLCLNLVKILILAQVLCCLNAPVITGTIFVPAFYILLTLISRSLFVLRFLVSFVLMF